MIMYFRSHILRTFRGRLAMLYITVECSILLISAVLLYYFLSRQVYQQLDDTLNRKASSLVQYLELTPMHVWPQGLVKFSRADSASLQLVAMTGDPMFTKNDNLMARQDRHIKHAFQQALRGQEITVTSTTSLLGKDNIRVLAKPIHRDNRVIAVLLIAHSTVQIQGFFTQLYWVGGMLGLLSIIISAYAGYTMTVRSFRPLVEINRTARAVAAGDMSRRLKSRAQDEEISELVGALNQMFQALEDSFVAQKHFTADASHELRIPLTILKGEIEVALRNPRSNEEYENILKQNLSTIGRMHRIVDDLLMLARADAGQLELAQETIDFSLLLQEIGQHHLILYSQKQLNLEIDVEDDLEIIGDESALERVMYNLLNNAYKYAPEATTIALTARAKGEWIHVQVQDQGPGIDSEHQQHLFNRFYRSDDARDRKNGGAGLGLAICKRIIDVHGGHIAVASVLGDGATFEIELPLSKGNPAMQRRLNQMLSTQQET
ncbi:MAG: ATP-binding protein [Mariprofundaceae bacterium]|nr:ATP-binding protein [Mariprofundaceae bacterium]